MVEAAYLFNCRSLSRGFWQQGLFSNLWVWGGLGAMLVLQLAMTYLPAMNRVFASAPIGLAAWLEIAAAAVLVALAVGMEKRLGRAGRGV